METHIKTIREIFRDEYRIPDYQRPYSWEEDDCRQLVEDFVEFHKVEFHKDKERRIGEPYSLGCIVITRETEHGPWSVIDGQQRLTTLLLLIKALHEKSGFHVLRECYEKTDPKTGVFNGDFRLQSEVIEGDREKLKGVLALGSQYTGKDRFSKNFKHMVELLDSDDSTATSIALEQFVMKTFLHRVVSLTIQCTSEDDALTIFNRLNDRGRQLTDADIFKVHLYRNVADREDEKKNFVDSWKELMNNNTKKKKNDNYDVVRLFTIYMHVLRAKDRDAGKEEKLRTYFLDRTRKRLGDTQTVMDRLKKYKAVDDDWNGITPESKIWWHILSTSPTDYWEYPLYVFLDKYATYEEGELTLSPKQQIEFVKLIKETARYIFIMGVATRTVYSIRNTIYNGCQDIAHGGEYHRRYRDNSRSSEDIFIDKLKNCDYGRYQRGLVLVSSALHNSQENETNREKYAKFLTGKYQIEHILPRKWNHYDGWTTDEEHSRDISKLGNLIPLERELNIAAANEFFARKRNGYRRTKGYKDSANPEARCLGEGEYGDKWLPETLEERNKDVLKRLKEFFDLGDKP